MLIVDWVTSDLVFTLRNPLIIELYYEAKMYGEYLRWPWGVMIFDSILDDAIRYGDIKNEEKGP
jgi:hypothetical protein